MLDCNAAGTQLEPPKIPQTATPSISTSHKPVSTSDKQVVEVPTAGLDVCALSLDTRMEEEPAFVTSSSTTNMLQDDQEKQDHVTAAT